MSLGIGAEFLQEMQHYVATAIGNGVRRPLKTERTPSAECTRTDILLPLPAELQWAFMTPSTTFRSRGRVIAFVNCRQHVRIPRGESMGHHRNTNIPPPSSGGSLSRRSLLQRTGWTVAAAMFPNGVFAADNVSAVMAKLSAYMSEAGGRALPDEVVEKAKHHILDTFAAMISGSDLPPARAAFQYARDFTTDKTATIVASKMTSSPPEAAFINGMLAHSDETDDSNEFSQSHPGCAVVPAALAAGEKFGVDGTRFLRAVTLGYDIGPRVTATLGKLQYMVESHRSTHAIGGTFGAAAAAGCVASLTQ